MQTTRIETDSFGNIEVPSDVLWGAQTARSLHFFAIGEQRMPLEIIHALAVIKWAAAGANHDVQRISLVRSIAIATAALQIANGQHDQEFPLSVWQTGSGTQSNMNVNEVVAHLASTALQKIDVNAKKIHPNDEVNLGQSSNDVFPSAMHVAIALQTQQKLIPALEYLHKNLQNKSVEFKDVIKIGRTHLQDATPITLGQEFSGYVAQIDSCKNTLLQSLPGIYKLAIGGTAVGTGLNTHPEFGTKVAQLLTEKFSLPFTPANNLFAAMAGHEGIVAFHGALKMLAIALTKIGNDIRLMASGPRAGLGELQLPENEPGSSIMPGKVNPTQIEALSMVCAQIMGHDVAIGFAASQGHFELNVYKPLIALNSLDSIRLLSDAMHSFTTHCLINIQVKSERINKLLNNSLMLVTALTPHIGYDKAAQIAKYAHSHQCSLREAAMILGFVTEIDFERWVDPQLMLAPKA
ncbi:class II fumarate hydratase [Undibacterium flavidum]|uniref:Fumarate hydratase class II n=1 Tax=Undibacterium flavidum TaxID=2762297 RepID=A0ABR6YDA9_9BURK|nr:class II fumarate hydratase [Undibacterium flavidum]MBC3874517.1 class II fumarate hydratase [Undibacterium flavidum]